MEHIIPVLQSKKINLIGESKWQEAKNKLSLLPKDVEKHFIGHLQTNKISEVVNAFDAIESVDSLKLLQIIDKAAGKIGKIMPIFLQVNISRDAAKYGFFPEELSDIYGQRMLFSHINLIGLMTITAKQSAIKTRADYKKMKQLQRQFHVPELSMGMSDDWKIAVAEGATIVRLGTALFGLHD